MGDPSSGQCVDVLVYSRCQLAGEQGGRAACAAVLDADGVTPLCGYSQVTRGSRWAGAVVWWWFRKGGKRVHQPAAV